MTTTKLTAFNFSGQLNYLYSMTNFAINPNGITDRVSGKKLKDIEFSDGIGDNKANILYHSQLNQTGSLNIDLSGLTDAFNQVVSIEASKLIFLHNITDDMDVTVTYKGTVLKLGIDGYRLIINPLNQGLELSESEDSFGELITFVPDDPLRNWICDLVILGSSLESQSG